MSMAVFQSQIAQLQAQEKSLRAKIGSENGPQKVIDEAVLATVEARITALNISLHSELKKEGIFSAQA